MSNNENLLGGAKPPVVRNREIDSLAELFVRQPRRGASTAQLNGTGVRYPDRYILEQRSREKADDIVTAQNNVEMLTDIRLAKEVLVSSIMSPQDLVSTDVNFEVTDEKLPSEIVAPCKEFLDEHFTSVYSISEFLPEAIGDALFESGAYPLLVVPETALDSIINHSGRLSVEEAKAHLPEGFVKPIGILGPSNYEHLEAGVLKHNTKKPTEVSIGVAFALESFDKPNDLTWSPKAAFDTNCRVTDNFDALKLSAVGRRLSQESISRAMATHRAPVSSRLSQENIGATGPTSEGNTRDVLKRINERLGGNGGGSTGMAVAIAPVESYSRRPVGHPLVMKLPTESLIPVHVPGNPKEHVGYFLIQDQEGNPLHLSKGSQNYRQLANRLRGGNYDINNVIGDATYRQIAGNPKGDNPITAQAMIDAYGSIMEQDLKSRLQNGAYKAGVEINISNEIKRVMLARKASNSGTVLTFVPVSQVTYFAYYFNDDGFGESLMDKTKIISSIRSVLLFANTMMAVRKAVGNTELNIELDPDDDDPATTVEQLFHEFSRTRNTAFPIASNSANDTVTYLQNAGISVAVTGNKNYPETKVSQQDRSMGNVDVDTELEDSQRAKQWQGFGLSPELIDGLSSPNFAESIVSGNLLMAKRVLVYQKKTVQMISEHIRQYVYSDGTIFEELVRIIGNELHKFKPDAINNLYEYYELDPAKEENTEFKHVDLIRIILNDLVDSYTIQLPEPDVSKFKQQVEAMNEYKEGLEQALPHYITADMVSTLIESDEGQAINDFYSMVRSYFMREWMRRNNVFPELEVLLDLEGDSGANIVSSVTGHNEKLQRVLQGLKRVFAHNSRQYEFDKDADQQKDTEEFGKDLTEDASSGGGGGGDFGGGDDMGGFGDDLGGGGDDLGGFDDMAGAGGFGGGGDDDLGADIGGDVEEDPEEQQQ